MWLKVIFPNPEESFLSNQWWGLLDYQFRKKTNFYSISARNEILGDVIALTAAVLYGISNVGQEYLVKKYSAQMYLGIVGIVGFVITGLQT